MDTTPEWLQSARDHWLWRGQTRPPFAHTPGPGQVSVWDFPRPPRIEPDRREVIVSFGSRRIVCTRRALKVLETSQPPTFYVPLAEVDRRFLQEAARESICEWKGRAQYWSLVDGDQRLERIGWSYPEPFADATMLAAHIAFYPAGLQCTVGGAPVQPQPGGFYGGWITPELVGPFKGGPGTSGW